VQPPPSDQTSATVRHTADDATRPKAEAPSALNTRVFNFIAPYRALRVPPISWKAPSQIDGLVRDGKLYLSLHDAIVLAVQNNLDIEVSRYNLLLADTDLTRAQGGGNLRGLDFTVQQTALGIGAATSPLLITATTGNAASTSAEVTDLSQVTQTGSGTQQNLSQNGISTFPAGPLQFLSTIQRSPRRPVTFAAPIRRRSKTPAAPGPRHRPRLRTLSALESTTNRDSPLEPR
jgi:hypothetical protein